MSPLSRFLGPLSSIMSPLLNPFLSGKSSKSRIVMLVFSSYHSPQ